MRELLPQDLKLEVDRFTDDQAVKASRWLAFVVGKRTRGRWMARRGVNARMCWDMDRCGMIDT